MPIDLLLYTRSGCELCDRALDMFDQLCAEGSINSSDGAAKYAIKKVDIAGSEELTRKYGLSIPILERSDNAAQLCWPFPPSRLRDFLLAE